MSANSALENAVTYRLTRATPCCGRSSRVGLQTERRFAHIGRAEASATHPTPQVWHTDLMYLWICGRWYFFMAVLDGFSRFMLHCDLLASMRSAEVVNVIHAALEKYPGEKPRLVHDNGPQFTGKEFRDLIKRFTLEEIRIRVYHPESNGKIERFHGLLHQEGLSDQELKPQLHAQDIIGRWVEHYNQQRLHASLAYLTPQDWLLERQQSRLAGNANASWQRPRSTATRKISNGGNRS